MVLQREKISAIALLLLPFAAGASNIGWCDFRLQQLTVLQPYGYSFSGEVSWNPCYYLGRHFAIRGNIGGTLLKGFPDKFVAAEYDARLSYAFNRSLSIEAGGGAQTWFQDYGGTSPMLSAAVSWLFFRKIPWMRAGITAGYAAFLPKDNLTHEASLGAMLAFGTKRR